MWIQENNFFKYNFEENKWIKLPAMKPVQYFPDLHVLDGYIYSVGAISFDEDLCTPFDYTMQRYNLSAQEWEEVIGEQCLRMDVMSSVLINGHILCKGVSCDENDEDAGENDVKYWAYQPGTDSWFKVECNDDPIFYYSKFGDMLHVFNNTCYLLSCTERYVNGKTEFWRKGFRLTCDFESEPATLHVIAEEVDQTELGAKCLYPYDFPKEDYLTFDKRKLGMSKEPNKGCVYNCSMDHNKDN